MNKTKLVGLIKRYWSSGLIAICFGLILVPKTGVPIKVFLNRMLAFSPSVIEKESRPTLKYYDWRLRNEKGEIVNFNQSKGKVIFVSYWATWCPPCLAELPSINSLHAKYENEVDFYFITSDDSELISDFMKGKMYDFPNYFPVSRSPNLLETNSLPTNFLLNKEGEIVIKKKGAAKWDSEEVFETINELLKD